MSSGGGLVHGRPVTERGDLHICGDEPRKHGETEGAGALVRENAMLRSALSVALAALGEHSRRISECEGRLDGYDTAMALLNGSGGRIRHLHSVERSASG
jgi:hypothetical protein